MSERSKEPGEGEPRQPGLLGTIRVYSALERPIGKTWLPLPRALMAHLTVHVYLVSTIRYHLSVIYDLLSTNLGTVASFAASVA